MKIVIQRVSEAAVNIDGTTKSSIGQGYMILLGITHSDTQEDADWLVKKVIGLRVFDDENHVMNRSITDVDGDILVVSQFTLMASYKKGNRFVSKLEEALGKRVGTGEFGADMKVSLINDGPVTICMDTNNKE